MDPQILFANDDKLWEYLEWDSAAMGVSYFRWRLPKISEVEEDLLSGVRGICFSHPSFTLTRITTVAPQRSSYPVLCGGVARASLFL